MKKIFILSILLLLFLPIIYADENIINIYNVSNCYGQVEVKVRADNLTMYDFVLIGCNIKNSDITRWVCSCKNNAKTVIDLNSKTDKNLIFDFVLEYKLDAENNNITGAQSNKRTTNINNVEINSEAFKKKGTSLPSIEGSKKIFVYGGLSLLFIVFIIILIFRKIMSTGDNSLEQDKEKIKVNKDINKFLDS